MQLAPVLLFTYKRLDQTRQTVNSLQRDLLADRSELFIFSDGPKNESERVQVRSVRNYIRSVSGFKRITIFESDNNKGLAVSIITGVTELIKKYGRVIVLEDDLLTSTNFLTFLNKALQYYEDAPQVFSVAGYTVPIRGLAADETYFTRRASSWGWATWKEQWDKVDWEVKDYELFRKNKAARKAFNQMGSDLAGMLDKQMQGEINSWAIRWCYHQYKNNLVTVFPASSKVSNIGFTEAASHTKQRINNFGTELDRTANTEFIFPKDLTLNDAIIKQFVRPFSISQRVKNKILNALPSL